MIQFSRDTLNWFRISILYIEISHGLAAGAYRPPQKRNRAMPEP